MDIVGHANDREVELEYYSPEREIDECDDQSDRLLQPYELLFWNNLPR